MKTKKHVVIAGGGFAGLNLAKKLAQTNNFSITLVDKNNYHFFPPLLYQVSTAFIESSNIIYPFRKMFHDQPVRYFMGSAIEVNAEKKILITDSGQLDYDILVLAMGTETNYFGNEKIREYALPMKTIDDALQMRNHILIQMECAVRLADAEEKKRHANLVIAGGGPTGVELAGMFAEMATNIIKKDYPEATSRVGNIYLIDSGDALLGPMSEKSQAEAYHILHKLGVNIVLGKRVNDYDGENVTLSDGSTIPSNTLIWATGVIARKISGIPSESITRGNRLLVDAYNHVNGMEDVYSIGDQCMQLSDEKFPQGHPQLAQVAIQQGKFLARNLSGANNGKQMQPFKYFDKGSMAIIAKYKAVVDLPKGFFKGFIAWMVWLFIHIIPIAGFRNKVKLSMNWMWSFLTNDPTLRVIVRPRKQLSLDEHKPKVEVTE